MITTRCDQCLAEARPDVLLPSGLVPSLCGHHERSNRLGLAESHAMTLEIASRALVARTRSPAPRRGKPTALWGAARWIDHGRTGPYRKEVVR